MRLSSVHAAFMTTPLKNWRIAMAFSQREMALLVEQSGQKLFGEEYTCEDSWIARWEKGRHVPAPRHLLAILVATRGTVRPLPGRLSLEELIRP